MNEITFIVNQLPTDMADYGLFEKLYSYSPIVQNNIAGEDYPMDEIRPKIQVNHGDGFIETIDDIDLWLLNNPKQPTNQLL